MKCFLNRQAITLLSCLGIEDSIFMDMLNDMLILLDKCLKKKQVALDVLDTTSDEMACGMLHAGFELQKEPFLLKYVAVIS